MGEGKIQIFTRIQRVWLRMMILCIYLDSVRYRTQNNASKFQELKGRENSKLNCPWIEQM